MPTASTPIQLNAQGAQVQAVQANLTKVGLTVPVNESSGSVLGTGTANAIKQFQAQNNLPPTGTVDAVTQSMLNNAATVATANQSHVSGQLVMDYGLPANIVTMRLYSIGYGGAATKLVEAKTDANGVYSLPYAPPATGANVEVRVVDSQGKETTVSSPVYNAGTQTSMNLIAPATVQPLTPEFQRLSTDVQNVIGGSGIQNLAQAQETNAQQDLTLLNQTTGWDARLLALAATAAQQATAAGLGADTLYALYRTGLPTDPSQLALIPPATITLALNKTNQAGITNFTDQQISAATTAFQGFAARIQLTLVAAGGVSNFGDLLKSGGVTDSTQSAGFINLAFSQPTPGADFWQKAAALNIPAAALTALQVQGKCFYLTLNNLPLTQKIQQDIGPTGGLSQLAEKDYHDSVTWKTALNGLAGTGGAAGLAKLIPSAYASSGNNGLEAYAADLARKVRVSFPTQTAARLLERGDLSQGKSPLGSSAAPVSAFLRTAAGQGYQLGRTPLNTFMAKSGKTLPALSSNDTEALKTLHRMYQVTPSNESLQAALKLGFTSANQIASSTRSEFIAQYASAFPSVSEAELVYRKSQQVSSVTFNFFAMAKQLDTNPPIYALSSSPQAVQDAKNSIIEQFPSMQTLFGSMDFCQCDDCRSVLSPAAYFVDLLEFLGNSTANAAGYTPLDVLVGYQRTVAPTNGATEAGQVVTIKTTTPHSLNAGASVITSGVDVTAYNGTFKVASVPDEKTFTYNNSATGLAPSGGGYVALVNGITGRRPDLAALPLTCENTETAMPYIDIVNEILEYFITQNPNRLDGGLAYDTGNVTTDDLTAEPQNILPNAYSILMKPATSFGFPLGLPFDLWVETVRGFYLYFKTPLAKVLDALRPADQLELFTDANSQPYYRASIFCEALGLSPGEYAIFTNPNPMPSWFGLYSYPSEAIALNGGTYPAAPPNFSYSSLVSAKCLAQYLGLTYQELTDLITVGFLNPALAAISFQFERFGINMDLAFSYTGQPGFTQQPGTNGLSPADTTAFEATLAAITQQYKTRNPSSTFDAKAWLKSVLPANYSTKVLVLHDVDSGCNFSTTTLIHADGSPATNLDFLKINLFVRLWKKLGWTMDETDRALQLFFAAGQGGLPAVTDPGFGAAFSSAWATALVYLAHLDSIASQWQPAMGRIALLPLWTLLSTTGNNPLYAQIFLTPAVLNSDPAFDDPLGQFPGSPADPLSQHQAGIQGALNLSAGDVAAILADAGKAVTTVAAMVNGQNIQVPSFSLANLSLLYRYNLMATSLNLSITDFIALKAMSVDTASLASGVTGLNPFTPPAGNPLKVLKDDLLFTQTLQFVQQAGIVANSGFTVEDLRYLLLHQYDPVGKYRPDENALLTLIQSMTAGLLQIQNKNAVPGDLKTLSDDLIQQKLSSLFPAPLLAGVLGLLANTTGYTASQSGVAPGSQIDPTAFSNYSELSFSYDPILQTQSLVIQGALLDWKKNQLLQLNPTAPYAALLTALLNQAQQQAKPAFDNAIGNLLGVWASLVQYEATRPVASPIVFTTSPADPALEIGYDADNKIQWASYRGVLTGAKMNALTAVNASADFAALLAGLQTQSLAAFNELFGFLLGLWANLQSYQATQTGVAPANQIDPSLLSAYPQIQATYDAAGQTQTLTVQGVLTSSVQSALGSSIPTTNPAYGVLTNLLQLARSQAMTFVQAQAANWTTLTAPADWNLFLDNNSQPYTGLSPSRMLKAAKGELIKVFSPLLAGKLSLELIVQTLSSALSSDSSMTASLLTDPGLLPDPTNPGRSLLGAFLALGQPGVSATYYASADQSGPPLGTGTVIAATTSTSDASNPNASAVASVHFEGYLQVTTDGPYRFFAALANSGSRVQFHLDAPPSASPVTSPVLDYTATKNSDEVSQFVELLGGVAYHFTLDFTSLGAGGTASLLIQGENLPKGSLNQVQLYAEAAVDRFTRARILLAKVVQLIQGTGLDLTELGYLTANPQQFSGFNLAALPSQPVTDSPPIAAAKAEKLFAQFLALADYADLKKGPAGGSNGLIAVFQNVGQTFTEPINSGASNQNLNTPWTILGNLTRRDPQVVRDVAVYFGLIQQKTAGGNLQLTAVGDFGNNHGIRRIWEALLVIQTLGLPVAAVINSTQVVSPARLSAVTDPGYGIAGNLRNAVKAQYTDDLWRPVAKSVFNPLRQKKRDALTAYVVRDLLLENEEQLFEYFLVDPGMEPVVQTSRLRLALSSVQTFIQRCLLNLENAHSQNPNLNVAPSAVDADWWAWMKRYRVWEANREIFLYPENWMEPELRLDKTDLFQTLESALLKGDVTRDLVEDAFYKYLQGLDVRARLDIVATYLDQTGPQDATDQLYPDYTVHVVGRTHCQPHQYFYRTYANGVWTAWTPVTAPIEGDHLAVTVWRNRVNLFWVNFNKACSSPQNPQPDDTTKSVSQMNIQDLQKNVSAFAARQQIPVQLNWSEYFQGKWSERLCSDVSQYEPVPLPTFDPSDPTRLYQFDPGQVYIHVTKEPPNAYGNDGPVLIHLDFPMVEVTEHVVIKAPPEMGGWGFSSKIVQKPMTYSFRVTSKNCNPDFGTKYQQPAPENPYTAKGIDATQYTGSASVEVEFTTNIASDGTGSPDSETILHQVNDYALVLCSNPVSPPFLPATDPLYTEAGALVAPFFFKDINVAASNLQTTDELTFFVQPSLTEQTIDQWTGWTIGNPVMNPALTDSQFWKNLPLVSQVPANQFMPSNPGAPAPVGAIYRMQNPTDWLTTPSTTVGYKSTVIGSSGNVAVAKLQNAGTQSPRAVGAPAISPGRAGTASFVGSQGLTAATLRNIQLNQAAVSGVAIRNFSVQTPFIS
jgi:hypothetical protein